MKKTYIKPQLWVMATATNELLQQTSWCAYPTNKDDKPGDDDYGKIIEDKGEGGYGKDEYDPWDSNHW